MTKGRVRSEHATAALQQTPTPVPLERIRELDAELAGIARNGGALRLALGVGFEALAKCNGPLEMGFSSLEAYALERCGRSESWVRESRNLAVALDKLPLLRSALLAGRIRWSLAVLLARHVCAEDEPLWTQEAERRTFREMRWLVFGPRVPFNQDTFEGSGFEDAMNADDDSWRTLTLTANREDFWLYECARRVVGRICGHHPTADTVVEALVAEGTTTLQSCVPEESRHSWQLAEAALREREAMQRAWEAQLAAWRDQAEARCEHNFLAGATVSSQEIPGAEKWLFDGSVAEMDLELRNIADELATRDVAIGRLAEAFWKADGWRQLGYASAKQYASERLGIRLSSIKEKRDLARRLENMPALERALQDRSLGYESARLVARVATPQTAQVWIGRAEERTVKHLREETQLTDLIARLSDNPAPAPPSEALVDQFQAIESQIVSGAAFVDTSNSTNDAPYSAGVTDSTDSSDSTTAGQMSAQPARNVADVLGSLLHEFDCIYPGARKTRSRGRVTLKLRVRDETYRDYRRLERLYYRFGPRGHTFLGFLCLTLIDTWKHALGTDVAYGQIYARDRYQCRSPVCCRRDVTPHHLLFRSAGGDDSDENLASLCVLCHLKGIHGHRIQASAFASCIHWAIGRVSHTFVIGRRKVRAKPLDSERG